MLQLPKKFFLCARAHMYYKSSLRRKLEIQSDDAISDGALYHPPRNVRYIYRGNVTISEFFEAILEKKATEPPFGAVTFIFIKTA